ncbi:MAG: DUF2922 domain-containing protein [Eubacteriales bacterium]|jgi:hypothetical protein|nr:DUF2922 domain-containing protein [Clostridia bacterium]MDZ4042611.1 DUF2922 domain-containing protein [Eubacteriales bacterium]MDZ7610764.1 DUF2922 domain-containing protein [Eubacteriales bacterium]
MAVVRTLELRFSSTAGTTVTLRVPDPKADLTGQLVETAMNGIIAGDVFSSSGGALIGIAGARIVQRETTDLDLI